MVCQLVRITLQVPIHLPEKRHSHTAAVTNSGIFVTGGLTKNMKHLHSVIMINYQDIWSLYVIKSDPLLSNR